jgi:hypothetical protein
VFNFRSDEKMIETFPLSIYIFHHLHAGVIKKIVYKLPVELYSNPPEIKHSKKVETHLDINLNHSQLKYSKGKNDYGFVCKTTIMGIVYVMRERCKGEEED